METLLNLPQLWEANKATSRSEASSMARASTAADAMSSLDCPPGGMTPPGSVSKMDLEMVETSSNATSSKYMARELAKTKFCKHALRGYCRYGESCAYAHTATELMPRPNYTKTKICVKFLSGTCNQQDCSYAHGFHELRQAAPSVAGSSQTGHSARGAAVADRDDALSDKRSEKLSEKLSEKKRTAKTPGDDALSVSSIPGQASAPRPLANPVAGEQSELVDDLAPKGAPGGFKMTTAALAAVISGRAPMPVPVQQQAAGVRGPPPGLGQTAGGKSPAAAGSNQKEQRDIGNNPSEGMAVGAQDAAHDTPAAVHAAVEQANLAQAPPMGAALSLGDSAGYPASEPPPPTESPEDGNLMHDVLMEMSKLLLEERTGDKSGQRLAGSGGLGTQASMAANCCLLMYDRKEQLTFTEEQLVTYLFLRDPSLASAFPGLSDRLKQQVALRLEPQLQSLGLKGQAPNPAMDTPAPRPAALAQAPQNDANATLKALMSLVQMQQQQPQTQQAAPPQQQQVSPQQVQQQQHLLQQLLLQQQKQNPQLALLQQLQMQQASVQAQIAQQQVQQPLPQQQQLNQVQAQQLLQLHAQARQDTHLAARLAGMPHVDMPSMNQWNVAGDTRTETVQQVPQLQGSSQGLVECMSI